ncbi:hypothetical protein NDU88_004815 [Pleurodeles waltl]|uniref:Uncharacterized protein n=1 Tax=Pleurodeles waltl TaxID=8319 RepID=A0AAV7WTH7_PLEWA|nr:hypothetical protein NDU88_004815 [Pleurodeles waltl]
MAICLCDQREIKAEVITIFLLITSQTCIRSSKVLILMIKALQTLVNIRRFHTVFPKLPLARAPPAAHAPGSDIPHVITGTGPMKKDAQEVSGTPLTTSIPPMKKGCPGGDRDPADPFPYRQCLTPIPVAPPTPHPQQG